MTFEPTEHRADVSLTVHVLRAQPVERREISNAEYAVRLAHASYRTHMDEIRDGIRRAMGSSA